VLRPCKIKHFFKSGGVRGLRPDLRSDWVAAVEVSAIHHRSQEVENFVAHVQGRVTNGVAYLTHLGQFDVDVAIEGMVLLVRQQDRPGLVAAVANALAGEGVNVSFMTVGRVEKGKDAIMCIGVDSSPSQEMLEQIEAVDGIIECGLFNDQ
jgi:predicted regulator of amino acid metabolism with ACT domain